MLTLNSNSLLVRTKSNATAICQCRPVRGLYPTASYTSTDAHNGLCRRAPGLLPSHRRWRSALRHVAVNAKSSEQGSRAELAADRPSQGLQQLPQPEIRDTKPSRVFLSHIPKRLRAALLGLAVAVPVLLCRPAPAHAQRPEDGHGLPVTARIDSNYGASSSGRLLAERALRRHRSASDGTIGQGAPLHLYSSNNVIIGDLAALSGPDDGISGPAYGLGPTLSAGDADNDLTAQELQTVQMFQQQRSSIVNVTHMRSMQSFQTLDVHKQPFGQGSGFIWDTRGHIVTSYRLCKGAGEMKVTLHDHNTYTAKVVGYDAAKDLSVLKLSMPKSKAKELVPVSLGSSARLQVGQTVFTLGNAMGLDHTLSKGIICGLGRELGSGLLPIKQCIMTDAWVDPGGGVLLDSRGRVIGICAAVPDASGRSAPGFAVPIDTARSLIEQILVHGRVVRPALGITVAPPEVLAVSGLEGVLVLEVPAGFPAHASGLRPTHRDIFGTLILGDVIVGIDSRPVRCVSDLGAALDDKRVGDRVGVAVMRDGKQINLTLILGERVPGAVDE